MRYMDKVVNVIMPFTVDVQFTENDLVFGLTGYDYDILFRCYKDSPTGQSYSGVDMMDYFTPFKSKSQVNAIKTYAQYLTAGPDELITKKALGEIITKELGKGYNIEGVTSVLVRGTDLNSIDSQSRYILDPTYNYPNSPVLSGGNSTIILETTKVSNKRIQLLTVISEDSGVSVFSRAFSSNWSRWTTDQQAGVMDEFTSTYNDMMVAHANSLSLANSIIGSLNDGIAKISKTFTGTLPLTMDVSDLELGYYALTAVSPEGHQVTANFSSNEVEYLNYSGTTITELTLSTNSTLLSVKLKSDTLEIVGSGRWNIDLIKLPLKIAEDEYELQDNIL